MTRIVYVDHAGEETEVDAENGLSVMEAAINNDIEGIVAECGGACACATCHVYVDESFRKLTGEPDDMEQAMLDFTDNVRDNSRLSCQIEINDELDGLRVTTPESQM
ncbi:MAG: 2Fe-2S iron-sulfur cluster-binding protein [Woeseiaceae bacterium]